MKKRIASALLVLTLIMVILPGAASAAGGLTNFTKVYTYQSGRFDDISSTKWYAAQVQTAYEYNLMTGTGSVTFSPDRGLTIGEAIKLAACINSIYNTGAAVVAEGTPWYTPYVDYALKNGIIDAPYGDVNATATRAEFVRILAKALPDEALLEKNSVDDNAIPDVSSQSSDAQAIYTFYRAGVLCGSDSKGSFLPDNGISRAEVAAIVSRMANADLRQSVHLSLNLSSEQIFQKCSPAVFYIKIYDIKGTAIKTGSGFFINADGLAVTNFHVVNGGAKATITTADGKEYDVSGVYDYSKAKDLALIKVDGTDFAYLNMADSDAINTGAEVFAIGSPLGFKNTISKGLISYAARTINEQTYIQTSAAISSGSSGGALLDTSGRVVGITSATASVGQNINLAIPINQIKSFKTDSIATLESLLPDTKYYDNLFPVPDFGAYSGTAIFSKESGLSTSYSYRISDLTTGLDTAFAGYSTLLDDNCFQYYGYAIENGRSISYYSNAAYGIVVTIGIVTVNGSECLRLQIMHS